MTLEELQDLVTKHDQFKAEGWRSSDTHAASLVIVRDRPPQGIQILTPFGRCPILNCQEQGGRFQTVFAVSRPQLVKAIAKIKREAA